MFFRNQFRNILVLKLENLTQAKPNPTPGFVLLFASKLLQLPKSEFHFLLRYLSIVFFMITECIKQKWSRGQTLSWPWTKDATRKCFQKNKNIGLQAKNRKFSAKFQAKKQKSHDLSPVLTNDRRIKMHQSINQSKNSAVLYRGQGIFEDL